MTDIALPLTVETAKVRPVSRRFGYHRDLMNRVHSYFNYQKRHNVRLNPGDEATVEETMVLLAYAALIFSRLEREHGPTIPDQFNIASTLGRLENAFEKVLAGSVSAPFAMIDMITICDLLDVLIHDSNHPGRGPSLVDQLFAYVYNLFHRSGR